MYIEILVTGNDGDEVGIIFAYWDSVRVSFRKRKLHVALKGRNKDRMKVNVMTMTPEDIHAGKNLTTVQKLSLPSAIRGTIVGIVSKVDEKRKSEGSSLIVEESLGIPIEKFATKS